MKNNCQLTILIPCLNEEKTIDICIKKAMRYLQNNNINGEVLVSDNGSLDNSKEIALKNNARIIEICDKGYGNALIGGIKAANGKFIIMGDADDSYDFLDLNKFMDKLLQGYELVMGNRFSGNIEKGAMPYLNRYIGNPVISYIGKKLYKCNINDFHCGLRGFEKKAILNLDLKSEGMEFASEMVIKGAINNLKMTEVPITLYKDGRNSKSHLNPFRDGLRHLKIMNECRKL